MQTEISPYDVENPDSYPAPQNNSLLDASSNSSSYPSPAEGPDHSSSFIDQVVSFWQRVVDCVSRLLAWDITTVAAQGSDAQTTQSSSLPVTSISYTYDGLDRLTQAAYASGETYTYDKVGNRTSQTNPGGTVNYTYNATNRLTSVNGTAYTWDDNGNLLSDGSSTYTYDHANRLIGVAGLGNTYSFAYNGLGDRYQQIANGSPVNYTLDLSGALSQVLSDGQNTYLYGLGRIAQESLAGKEYFLPDGLGSVRQLADASGSVTLSQSFDPFGSLRSQGGASASSYGFAGEWTDATGLQHLRARYYSPQQGRFLTGDPFPGFLGMPQTQNPYIYALNNPALLTDPSGEFAFIPLMAAAMLGGAIGGIAYYGIRTALSNDPCAAWDWMQAALWGGAGAIMGAALGLGIYGGWWVGAHLGWWGTVLGADGDPTNEAFAVARVIQNGLNAIRSGIGRGYNTFEAFKRAEGVFGLGRAWHHIVPQTTANVQRFGAQVIHNTNNILRLPHGAGSMHQQITNFYNSIQPYFTGSDTLRVYQWLETLSFEEQWMFGIQTIQRLGGTQYIIDQFLKGLPW